MFVMLVPGGTQNDLLILHRRTMAPGISLLGLLGILASIDPGLGKDETLRYIEDHWQEDGRGFLRYLIREQARRIFSWGIPDDRAMNILLNSSPVVEIGAGSGYWAMLACAAGCLLDPFDIRPGALSWRPRVHHAVEQGGSEVLETPAFRDHALLLCWPPFNTPMALHCLERFRGNRIIYIGEMNGATGSPAFHEQLRSKWILREHHAIPRWDLVHDALHVFERR